MTALTAEGEILTESGASPFTVTLIPWFSRANRGASPVSVWIAEDPGIVRDDLFSFGKYHELKEIGAKYRAETNAHNPQGRLRYNRRGRFVPRLRRTVRYDWRRIYRRIGKRSQDRVVRRGI